MPLSEQALRKRREYNKRYDRDNKEWIAEKRVAHRLANQDMYNERMQAYRRTTRGRANRMYHGAKSRAHEKGIDFDLTIDWLAEILEIGRCQRTGIEFVIANGDHLLSPSVDRIDSSAGYTKSNVQVVCMAYNLGKRHLSDEAYEDFILEAAGFISARRNKE